MSDQRNVGVIGDRGSISREKIWGFGDWFPTKMCGSINFGQMMVISAFLRLGLIAYGEWQDAHMEVRYTDIDYFVFSDAAALVASGKSPFERSTYRYSPLLAFLLIPNSILHQSWGKLLFSSADLLVGLFVDIILKLRSVPETLRLLSVAVWLFNPFTFTIGTRGNCEPIVCAMILWIIICIMNGKVIQAAFWYGLVVHFRIYPIIYALPFVLVLNNQHARPGECILKKGSFRSGVTDPSSRARVVEPSTTSWKQLFCPWVLLRSNITINSFLFGLISGSIFFFCTALFFKLYGWEFLNEGLLYHLTRTDPRHNFSIYFYHIYLHHQHKLSLVEKLISFLPQLMVQLALIFRFAADLPFCLFLQTVAFVAFNKVITAQYFVWFFCLLPLILPWSSMKLKWKGLICISLWMGSQLHWLLWGYILEFKGWNVFIQLWLASILFLAANTVILLMLVNVEEERRERSRKAKERRKEKRRSSPSDDPKPELDEPESVLRLILDRYPDVASDLRKLLEMLDNGQGVDLSGISDKSLVKLLKKLFQSLNLDQNEKGVFLLPPLSVPTLEVIGSTLRSYLKPKDNNEFLNSGSPNEQAKVDDKEVVDAPVLVDEPKEKDSAPSRRRVIGPEMPSRELLAAAAELTQAEATLREAEVEVDNDLFIGPPPPAIVAEAESANEAERFEEVSRIAGAEVDKPYDVLAVNWKMSFDNIKKRYWKLSLMVHPDKCSHPQAHQAFVILNQAFKDLQDPDKRKAIDEKIKLKEEKEQFEAELKELREAARWRQSQGISLEGDEELLAVVKEAPKRDEWMTTLPPERKPGMAPRQSTSFSKTGKEGRGDTSVWTDSPSDRAEKAKLNYLEAYNKAKAISDIDGENSKRSSNASLVDEYNASKRSVSLLQKHQEKGKHPKKKSKLPEKEEWVGAHPWKPWDRETDLSAGRKKVDLDSKSMGQGLTSRFSSGPTQRNFL